MAKILVADDEVNLRKVLCTLLLRAGFEPIAVADGAAALEMIQQQPIDVLITDLKMPNLGGLELLQAVKNIDPGLPVIVITAHGSVDTAVSALKNGAFDYITKPFDKDELKLAVHKAQAVRRHQDPPMPETKYGEMPGRYRMIGISERMQSMYAIIDKIAATPATVLVTGESGTGKELVASALHDNSLRCDKPFIKVNCSAIPKDLIESEFFGYEPGAFTGAVTAKPGRFELADGGTLFLDEIGDISPALQVKLLRVLQESEFERVGGVKTTHVDVRLIAATNRDLLKEIAAGNFREDLYYRLNVVPIALPALRERPGDIIFLVEHFISKYNKRLNKKIVGMTPKAQNLLSNYPWPGNIRELENVIERTMLLTEKTRLDVDCLPEEIRRLESDLKSDMLSSSLKDVVRQAAQAIERDKIIEALERTQKNVTHAANLLKISRKSLQNKMKELGLRDQEEGKNT